MGNVLHRGSPVHNPRSWELANRAAATLALHPQLVRLANEEPLGTMERVFPRQCERAENDLVNRRYHDARSRAYHFNDAGYPLLIVFPKSEEELVTLIKAFARVVTKNPPPLAVASGAHSNRCFPDGAVVIDMQHFKSVSVDAANKLVTVGAGCKIEEVERKIREAGLSLGFATGTNGDTGVTGLTIVGGFGYLGRKHGMAADNIVSLRMVLPDGEIAVAEDENAHKDLLRASRGGGGNFGVITQLVLRLHDVSNCFGGIMLGITPTMNSVRGTLESLEKLVRGPNFTNEMMAALALTCGRTPVTPIVFSYVGGKEARAVKTGADLPTKVMDELFNFQGPWAIAMKSAMKPCSYWDLQLMLAEHQKPQQLLMGGFYITKLDKEMIDVLVHFTRVAHPSSAPVVIVMTMGGKAMNPDSPNHSICYRRSSYWIVIEGVVPLDATVEDLERHKAWMKAFKDAIRDKNGSTVMFSAYNWENMDTIDEIYKADLEVKLFLREVKKRYDPNNTFRCNSNIVV